MTTALTSTAYEELVRIVRDATLLGGTAGILGWDQEVMMPPGGVAYRSRQLAQLARLRHEMLTDPRFVELVAICEADEDLMSDPLAAPAVNVREVRRELDRKLKLPIDLVEETAVLGSLGQHAWAQARAKSRFEDFRPLLERIVALLRRKAERYGWGPDGEPWDALAGDHEPACTARDVEAIFTPLRSRLRALLEDLMGSERRPSNRFNEIALPIEQQRRFVRFISEAFGFDYQRGRLDTSAHPFCSGSHYGDVRLTTRFAERNVNDGLGSTMHETGHGIYEQSLSPEHVGLPAGQSAWLAVHESQSRLWENQVGRSRAFWKWCHPKLTQFFGAAVADLSVDEVYGAANIVNPSFIRVDADEATYNMHVFVRFDIERAILRGDLDVRDVPEAWNAAYEEHLGVKVPDDARGCLQDVHWSHASMGYFPTYTLGNLYAAQFLEKANEDLPDLEAQLERGEFGGLRAWLNVNIHAHGRRYHGPQLCATVTGRPLSADPLLAHLEGKLRPLYDV